MKKTALALAVLLLAACALSACHGESTRESAGGSSAEPNSSESAGIESTPVSSESESSSVSEESDTEIPDGAEAVSVAVLPYEATPDMALDQGGNEVIKFTFAQDVKAFHILAIDETEALVVERHPDSVDKDYAAGESVSYLLILGEVMATRGFSYVGADGVTYEYALLYNGSGMGDPYFLLPVSELTGTPVEPSWEEIRGVGEHLILAKNESGSESLLYLHEDGTKTEIHREAYLQEGYFVQSPDGRRVLFNTYAWEYVAEVYLYDIAADEKRKLDVSGLHSEDTVAFMDWLDDRYFLFVSQYAWGTIVRGGDLYVYDTVTDTYTLLVDRQDDHLQIRSFSFEKEMLILDAPLYDDAYNETVDRSFEFPLEMVYRLIEEKGKVTLEIDDRLLFAVEVVEATEGKDFLSVHPNASEADHYALTANMDVSDLWVCEFYAAEYKETGWLYQISGAHYVGSVPANTPVYVLAEYTDVTRRFGVSCLDETGARRFFAVYYNAYDGSLQVEDITDLV